MVKRSRSEFDDDLDQPRSKRTRTGPRRDLSNLSDEILIRILSFLDLKDLLAVECVSPLFRALATDREIWRRRYYEVWVSSRGRRTTLAQRQRLDRLKQFAKTSQWLDHNQRLKPAGTTDWKRLYKIRSNWAIGAARVREIEIANPPSRPAIAKVHHNMVFTVDRLSGIRAWSQKDGTRVLRQRIGLPIPSEPTCLAVDGADGDTNIVVGFEDGAIAFFKFREGEQLSLYLVHVSSDGPLIAMAMTESYVMTVSKMGFLSIYQMGSKKDSGLEGAMPLITRLQSDASFSPVSVALRRAPGSLVASVLYAFNRLQSGWCLGLQEIRLSGTGKVMESRLASTIETAVDLSRKGEISWDVTSRSASSLPLPLHPQLMSAPTSLSYEHPFIVCSLADNTLMSFLVTSNNEKLEIRTGRRLWGHTSAISGVQVNARGKAVSISSKGNEIRAWELEDVMATALPTRTSTSIKAVDGLSGIAAAIAQRGSGLGLALHDMKRELSLTRRWVGFDDEQVVILGDRDETQIMALYDFT